MDLVFIQHSIFNSSWFYEGILLLVQEQEANDWINRTYLDMLPLENRSISLRNFFFRVTNQNSGSDGKTHVWRPTKQEFSLWYDSIVRMKYIPLLGLTQKWNNTYATEFWRINSFFWLKKCVQFCWKCNARQWSEAQITTG